MSLKLKQVFPLICLIIIAVSISNAIADSEPESWVLCVELKEYNASSVSVVEGTYISGDRDSLDFVDGDLYQVTESVGAPAIDIRFNFTNINTTSININCDMLYNHTGSH